MSSREHILKRFRETRDNTLSRLPFVKDEKDEKDEKEEEKEERSSHKLDQTISEPGPPPSLTPSASAFPHNISEPVSIDQSFPSRPSFSRRGTASSSSFVSEGEKGEGEEKKEEEKKKVEEEEEEEMTVDQEITEEAGRVKKSRQPTLLGVGIRVVCFIFFFSLFTLFTLNNNNLTFFFFFFFFYILFFPFNRELSF